MQIQCVICTDLITQTALTDIIGLTCGHIFHGLCIRTWLERSQTCPQCRTKTPATKQHKIYLTIAPEPEGVDVVTLTRSLDNLKYELKLKEIERSTLAKELDTYRTKASGLIKEVRKLETCIASAEEMNLQLKDMKKHANNTSRELSEAKLTIEYLTNELQQYKILKSTIDNSCTGDSENLIGLDPSQLIFLVNTFKKESSRSNKANENLKRALSKSETENLRLIKVKSDLQEDILVKNSVIESLKERVASIEKKSSNSMEPKSSGLNVPGAEGQLFSTAEFNVVVERDCSPPQPKKLKTASSIGAVPNVFCLPNKASVRIKSDRLRSINMMSGPAKAVMGSSSTANGFNYDGLGGHSKPDFFPSKIKKFTPKKKKK